MSKTTEVPIVWIERLMELGEKADVKVWVSLGMYGGSPRKDDSKLILLKGYIESAKQFLDEQQS